MINVIIYEDLPIGDSPMLIFCDQTTDYDHMCVVIIILYMTLSIWLWWEPFLLSIYDVTKLYTSPYGGLHRIICLVEWIIKYRLQNYDSRTMTPELWLPNYMTADLWVPNYDSRSMTPKTWFPNYDSRTLTSELWLPNYDFQFMISPIYGHHDCMLLYLLNKLHCNHRTRTSPNYNKLYVFLLIVPRCE